ncbi:uncharacterized protein LOC131955107 [Physella acuta]|uniref:uncharacterized protein LOC131955107 n=1 Tax=Physella acuta TaxID=109671 RepID=UPI0027DB75B5|nr:uncharacterized protein LOC131955107 [Physella acuta]
MRTEFTVDISAFCFCRGVVSFLGAVGHAFAIRTFVAMGLKDGVTLSFLFLSVSDLLYLISITAASVSYIFLSIELLSHFAVYFPVDPYGLNTYFINCGSGFYANTMLTITFLSIARCLSVAKPLWFRSIFGTTTVSLVCLISISSFCLVTSIPILVSMEFMPVFEQGINTTRLTLSFSANLKPVTYIIWLLRGSFVPFAVQLILIICVCVMIRFLRKAVKFRQKHTSSSRITHRVKAKKGESTTNNLQENVKLTRREVQVIRQMLVLSLVFIVCNVPKICINTTIFAVPEFSVDGRYGRMYERVDIVRDALQIFNSCFSIVIYYKYNSKFRAVFCF